MENNNFNNGGTDMLAGGFEAGSPVVKGLDELKDVLCQEVVIKSYILMMVGLLITAFACMTVTPTFAVCRTSSVI